jgi:hypothetical protein
LRDFSHQLKEKERDIEEVTQKTQQLEDRLREMTKDNEWLNVKLRQDNIVFYGVPEGGREDREDTCLMAVTRLLNMYCAIKKWSEEDVASTHRLGRRERQNERPRPLLVKMVRGRDKQRIISNRAFRLALGKEGLSVGDDLTETQRQTLKKLRDEGNVAYCRGSRLVCRPRDQRPSTPPPASGSDRQRDRAACASTRDHHQQDNGRLEHRSHHTVHTPLTPPVYSQGSDAQGSRGRGYEGGCAGASTTEASATRDSRAAIPEGLRDSSSSQRRPLHPGKGRGRGAGRISSVERLPGASRPGCLDFSPHQGGSREERQLHYSDADDDASPELPPEVSRPTTRLQTQRQGVDHQALSGGSGATQGRIDTMFRRERRP